MSDTTVAYQVEGDGGLAAIDAVRSGLAAMQAELDLINKPYRGRLVADVIVICVGCGREEKLGRAPVNAVSFTQCRDVLKAKGWHHQVSQFRCPECQQKRTDAKKAARKVNRKASAA